MKNQIELLKRWDELSQAEKSYLDTEFKRVKLLTPDFANTKTRKNQGRGFLSMIMHLAPANLSGFNVCPAASLGCKAACLNTAGRGQFDTIQVSRIRKTLFFVKMRDAYLKKLVTEVSNVQKRAKKLKLKPVVRLNGTSDLQWELIKINGKTIFELFPSVQFYDYTKIISRVRRLSSNPIKNYDLTFSASESNHAECAEALKLGFNVATVFDSIPKTYQGAKVINGDEHDLRFLDPKKSSGLIVGLKAKGKARKDLSGFVRILNSEVKAA